MVGHGEYRISSIEIAMVFLMHMRSVWFWAVAAASIVVLVFLALSFFTGAEPNNKREVRWLIAHKPTEVFDRAAAAFGEELSKASNGTMTLVIMTPEDLGYSAGDVPHERVMQELATGSADLASAYTVALGKEDESMWALSLPFLFSDYASLNRALDGEPGRALLSTIRERVPALRGLAFTMSGGYRIIVSKSAAISDISDMKGLRIATSGGPVAEATIRAFGATPVSMNLEEGGQPLEASSIDGIETTYSRLAEVVGADSPYTTYINETNHSMFLTAIVASESFYQSLADSERAALEKAARLAAAIEREDSIAFAASVKADLGRRGSVITAPSAGSLQEAVQAVYDSFTDRLGSDLVRSFMTQQ